jgi:hypothetical protein
MIILIIYRKIIRLKYIENDKIDNIQKNYKIEIIENDSIDKIWKNILLRLYGK